MIRHILRKDLRRFAAPIVAVWVGAAVLAILDGLHFGAYVAPLAVLLNFLLPMGCAALIAAAVQQEPLTTDTAYWLTRPYRRGALVSAKLLFAAITVHAPLGLFLAAVLWLHSVSPFASVIWEKELLVLIAVTAPALAMATITNTSVALGGSVIVTAALTALLDTTLAGPRFGWEFGEWMPLLLGLLILTMGATAIISWQYRKRTRWAARTLAVLSAASALAASALLPGHTAASLECALTRDGAAAWTIALDAAGPLPENPIWTAPRQSFFALPLRVSSPESALNTLWVEPLSIRLSGVDGAEWTAQRPRRGGWDAGIRTFGSQASFYQTLRPDPVFLRHLGQKHVHLEGKASVRSFATGAVSEFAVPARHVPVQGVGTCSAQLVMLALERTAVEVVCESTGPVGAGTEVTVLVDNSNWSNTQSLGYMQATTALPGLTWLSPLDRRKTLVECTRWTGERLDPESLKHLKVKIVPAIPKGCANVSYAFDVRDLWRWRVNR